MKVLLLISLLSIIFLQLIHGAHYEKSHKLIINRYPKKARSDPKKYINVKPAEKIEPRIGPFYTAFPGRIDSKRSANIPDSPYFSSDHKFEPKPRDKRILTETVMSSLRKKRSVESTTKHKQGKVHKEDDHTHKHAKSNPATTKHEKNKTSGHRRNRHKRRHSKSGLRQGIIELRTKPKKHTKNHKKNLRSRNAKHVSKPSKRSRDSKISKKHHQHHNATKVKGTKDTISRRLVGAQDAMIEDYPYVVSIQKNDEHWCTGSLLNPRLVITTANCVWKSKRVSRLKVRAGSWHTDRGGQLVGIQELLKHPAWSIRSGPDNDVALLLLDERIKFSDKVHAVDLPNRIMIPAFEDAWVVSWGAERRDGIFDKHAVTLQVYYARLMDRAKCNNITQRFGISVSENFICLSQIGKRAPCTRDTGAPAVSDGVLWGIASWGIRRLCGTERFPAMFSYLASPTNLDFITNATRFLMADPRLDPNIDRFPGA